jgi:aryl-alcohol dehydrogenase-like predicted oxidoreductase
MIPRFDIAPGYTISRLIKGGWHLAGGHGAVDRGTAIKDMAAFVEAGITTFDCADIYTGVEELIGDFLRDYPGLKDLVQVQTKYVPDLAALATLTAAETEATIDRSLRRLGRERLDLVQFHWWDYAVPGFIEAAGTLERLRQAGKIGHIGVTNFDVPRLEALLEAGIPVRAHQLQYSLLDDRPNHGMVEFCARHGIQLLCYGTVAGGFLSERWLGQPEPAGDFINRSLTKYKLIIDDFGGWALLQELLSVLADIAASHGTDIASIASAAQLSRPQVAAVIVGATNLAHLEANRSVTSVILSDAERIAIAAVTSRRQGPKGDVYLLERDRGGRHGRIIKYDLNKIETA